MATLFLKMHIIHTALLIFIFYVETGNTYHTTVENKRIFRQYYTYVDSLISNPSANPLTGLKKFLNENSDFAPVYQRIFQHYLNEERIWDAERYFKTLTLEPVASSHASWMLGKIYALNQKPDAALNAFNKAVQRTAIPLLLLQDIVNFLHNHSNQFNYSRWVQRLDLGTDTLAVVHGLWNYKKLNYEEGIRQFEIAGKLARSNTRTLRMWGYCYYYLGEYQKAKKLWRQGLNISRNLIDREWEAIFLSNLGIVEQYFNQGAQQLSYYDSSYAVAKAIGDLYRMENVAGNRAGYLNRHQQFEKALKGYQDAIQIATRIKQYRHLSTWYSGYASVLSNLGSFGRALDAYLESERYAEKSKYLRRQMILKLDVGDLYFRLRHDDLALRYYSEGLLLSQEKKLRRTEHQIKSRFGNLYFRQGKFEKARNSYQEYLDFLSLEGDPSQRSDWVGKIATTHQAEGSYDLAREKYLQAINYAIEDSLEIRENTLRIQLASLNIKTGNIDTAIQQYSSVCKFAITVQDSILVRDSLLGLGDAYKNLGKVDIAIDNYKKAALIIENTRHNIGVEELRLGYFSQGQKVYRELAHSFLQRFEAKRNSADLDSLFYALEMSKARSLQELKVSNNAHINSAEYKKYLEACRELRIIQRRLRDEASNFVSAELLEPLIAQTEAAQYTVIAQRMRLVRKSTGEQSQLQHLISLEAIQKQLKQSTLGLLMYHIDEELSFVLALNGDDIKVKRLSVSPSLLGESIDSLTTPLHHVKEDSILYTPFKAAIAHRLYQWLIKPIEESFSLPQQLVVVLDLTLINLPFELLLFEPPDKSEFTPLDYPTYSEHYLTNRYSFVYSPSASLLNTTSESVANNSNTLVFANPIGASPDSRNTNDQFTLRTGWRFDPLIYSQIEAHSIKDISSGTKVYNLDKATKTNFLREAPKYRNLHIASHAFVNTTFDAFSGLVLAATQDSTDDGLLMGYEIAALQLNNCNLVALSACETGRGKLMPGEGVLGLPRLFLRAGAKSVLMTQWKVDDRFASVLMSKFYNYYLKQGQSKANALTSAKREILVDTKKEGNVYYQHPFYWASFTLYGDPGQKRKSTLWYKVSVLAAALLLIIVVVVRKRSNLKIK